MTEFSEIPEQIDVLTIVNHMMDARTEPDADSRDAVEGLTRPDIPREDLMETSRPADRYSGAYSQVLHFLSTGRVRAVDLQIVNFQSHNNNQRSGSTLHDGSLLPPRSYPDGVFRYGIETWDHPDCEEFRLMNSAFEEHGYVNLHSPAQPFHTALVAAGQCVAISYVGSVQDYTPPSYIHHQYRADLPELEVRQDVRDLVDPDDVVVARVRSFSSRQSGGRCEGLEGEILEPYQIQ